ncbi:uncharacterized protein EI90DRAFT_3285666 [Cantharellus anzutake]|uniref:uncharacterized protein n=1 Tax=Cantharellus anzutake TaxID=1750568 RepID=UPI001903DB07|nr:uncharacterized protein EI90DRAFT_3285666 [Cantharellus anzutake]KAF8341585.1 hypothetical protein EI90DRAFT_3285666 [Cantharellus anzutake]
MCHFDIPATAAVLLVNSKRGLADNRSSTVRRDWAGTGSEERDVRNSRFNRSYTEIGNLEVERGTKEDRGTEEVFIYIDTILVRSDKFREIQIFHRCTRPARVDRRPGQTEGQKRFVEEVERIEMRKYLLVHRQALHAKRCVWKINQTHFNLQPGLRKIFFFPGNSLAVATAREPASVPPARCYP